MELPTVVTVQHPQYGGLRPEELGVGCARHWLVRLAAALKLDYAFFLDDSVRAWRGVTLVEDPLCPFGLTPGPKARFNPVPLASVLQYLAEPGFLQEEMPKLAAFGFARTRFVKCGTDGRGPRWGGGCRVLPAAHCASVKLGSKSGGSRQS
ncbi:unnamed protein product [Effrenium voratum]|nr:unnamed protein product [Effrenium voratum]